MKSTAIILLITLLVVTGCGGSMVDDEQLSGDLEMISEEYGTQWKSDYNYDTIIPIDNLTSFEEFLEKHPETSGQSDRLIKKYDKGFFKHSMIYAYVKSESSGSNRLTVEDAKIENGVLRLYMKHTRGITDDMGASVCLFGINRDKVKDVKSVEAMVFE